MKIRQGFVSNSSSSSFIVISSKGPKVSLGDHTHQALRLGDKAGSRFGQSQFGWEHEQYYDVYSKINFAYIQTQSMGGEQGEQWLNMLNEVLQEETNASHVEWEWDMYTYKDGSTSLEAYIDHQSAACEGENTELFDSKEQLRNFLFNSDSYIETDNDNR